MDRKYYINAFKYKSHEKLIMLIISIYIIIYIILNINRKY